MVTKKAIWVLSLAALLALAACSRQQSDWQNTRAVNTTDAYEQFLKKYPSGEFSAQAQARLKELYEQRDWQKARDTDTLEAYQAFVKQYPEGKYTEEARIRVENFTLAAAPANAAPAENAASAENAANAPPPPPPAAKPAPTAKPAPAVKPAPTAKLALTGPAAAPKSTAGEGGAYGVQLGAFKSSADSALKRWTALANRYPKVLGSLTPKVNPKKTAAGTLYRLQVADLSEHRARAICNALQAGSQACVVLKPG